VAVSIPAIDASSNLLHLGLRPDGTAEVPEDFDLASWYDLGGRPGGSGLPTAILGHVDSTTGPAIFFRLRDLRPGDEVEITLDDGTVAVYAVTGTEEYPKDQFPTAAVFGATREDVVRLVTCSGDFDRGARSYTDNLVVDAERVA
jgi:sortase (surface protein transpeptidase)